jgi:2-polyprenyl-3-methyl-5-hydroxy-6-metoxy-1,4-benzoquinol methylase
MSRAPAGRTLRSCGLCGGREFRLWWPVNGYDIGACVACGLVQVMQEVTDAELDALYTRGYYEGETDRVYQNYLADPGTKGQQFGEQLDSLVSEFSLKPGALLEIGCAFGLFLDQARRRGWSVRGTEKSAHAGGRARRELGLDVDTSPDALATVPSGSQDVVVLWDVIEHLRYPLDMMVEARRTLRPGGILSLTTGDVESLGARLYGRRWYLIAPPHHLFYFDRRSMAKLLGKAGFAVRRMTNGGGHPLESAGRGPRLLQWIARHDRHIGWRFKSGPILEVAAVAV